MSLAEGSALLLLGLALGAQVFLRPFWIRHRNAFLALAVLFTFGVSLYQSWVQYEAWAGSEYAAAFLEPGYFLPYAGLKFFAPPLLALLAALALGSVAARLNRRFVCDAHQAKTVRSV